MIPVIQQTVQEKYCTLQDILEDIGSAVVAFSGGVDSSLLLKAAVDVLGKDALAVTVVTPATPAEELARSRAFVQQVNARYEVIEINPLVVDEVRTNSAQRCYFCKKKIFATLKEVSLKYGMATVVDGSNLDDQKVYRPGKKALEELGIRSPLKEAGLTKDEIRVISKNIGLASWDLPSQSCLFTRFAYGRNITVEMLKKVDAAEGVLRECGFGINRVRDFGITAVIEVASERVDDVKQPDVLKKIVTQLNEIGYERVFVDPQGYRTGSMDEGLDVSHA